MPRLSYQLIVIGGGHAGVEAAWAAANVLREPHAVALLTIDASKIGVMSCNPAIGGLAKGQLVREIDALNGLMGLATDATGIQFKVLNASKGEAVRGPRAQCDKHAYAEAVQALIRSRPEIDVIEGVVERLLVADGKVRGVEVRRAQSGNAQSSNQGKHPESAGTAAPDLSYSDLRFELSAPAVVLTTGTFMRGLMHTGETKTAGGRFGESAAVGISAALKDLGFELGRLKTGTPPRLKRDSIRWDDLEPAKGDAVPVPFSDLSGKPELATVASSSHGSIASLLHFPALPQIDCRQTHTSREAHEIIRANLHRAPMYSGQIESAGPRYCPSIEDKVVRFADRETHGVFLEPESLRDDWIYCNGISTSLPSDVQDAIVRSMPGCENAHIYRYGYAVEYDMVRPHQIFASGMTKLVEGLFLAGQINGTSGYEEAAAQGLVAGLNAARFVQGKPEFIFGREQAYIGVLMDDLVTKTPVEPYRMFTSRAEHRLLLRADNSADRLTPLARELGLMATDLGRVRAEIFEKRRAQIAVLNKAIDATRIHYEPLAKVLRTAEFSAAKLREAVRDHEAIRGITLDDTVVDTVFAARRYEPYIEKARLEIERHAELEHRRIPADVDYGTFPALRTEARLALTRFKPATFGQAGRLEGLTPADVTLLAVLLKKRGDERRAASESSV
ncbi:MAG: tRNA uridine-5-carboxymethylaminomethyl(34) synthesis enzyme MnmG [Phycisphaerales bacterium]|nr:tRNA uridine-5-carboxymethylaminomethyl(34) synthesis enzyme MnmG [Phycisphaerales bacterium]